MTTEMKIEIDAYKVEAHRRSIYEFMKTDGELMEGRLALVVSNEDRSKDRLVSILVLSDTPSMNRDLVPVTLPDGSTWYAHCGMVTYCRRTQLGREIHHVSKSCMKRINETMRQELGLSNRGEKASDEPDYEKLYKETIKLLIQNGKAV